MFDDCYGLTATPFQLTPDPAFYVRTASHAKAQSCLGYGLAQGDGLIVITGEAGSGKSTLAAHLTATIDPQNLRAAQVNAHDLEDTDLLRALAQAFGLDCGGDGKAGALRAIEGLLESEALAGRRCLAIIDDTETLPVEALVDLRGLSARRVGSHPPLQTVLLGGDAFRVTLQCHSALELLRQRVIAAHRLEPMTRAEVEPYMKHRLERAGWNGSPQFDQRVFAELHAASGGNPWRVNQIAGRLLLLGAVGRRSRIDAMLLKAVLDEIEAERALAVQSAGAGTAAATPSDGLPQGDQARAPDLATAGAALTESAARIAELQQAVTGIAGQLRTPGSESTRSEIEALGARVAGLEARLDEQERALSQTLAMLVDWIEGGNEQSRAA